MANTTRAYGVDHTIGDILFNKESKEIFFSIDGGFFGKKSINLSKNEEGTYDMFVSYMKDNQHESVKIGKTFPVQDNDGNIVEGMTKGSLGLGREYSKELQKEIVVNDNGLFFTTHKLKEIKPITDTLVKVGWVTGHFGIEIEDANKTESSVPNKSAIPEISIDEDEIPF